MSTAPQSPQAGPSSTTGAHGQPKPNRARALSPASQQAAHLAKLMANPSKPVHIPAPPKEKELRAPRETMKNVSGSSAGAGSGEFHVYKHARRREYERIRLMEEKANKEKEQALFSEAQQAAAAASEAKTSKNRSRRDKKKEAAAKRKAAAASSDGGSGSGRREEAEEGAPAAKRIRIGQAPGPAPGAAPSGTGDDDAVDGEAAESRGAPTAGGGIKFRRPANASDDDEGEEDDS
ncbi:hypothetical protein OC834_001461 [Tilletia horrida]|uniref:DUF1168-domain-containing protein n=1 Tax=Tilletia horrida TaxID=155126 RepID=A0AAN6JMD2_9BASI|nr:hypothetical protein OC834_001461 [Tilletia horrida]KAK0538428.1 hypothetical protein OC842_001304 [Tilletia horrida]KAK0541268.1 hypothetical protein OC835_000252 [Tilletia horrida]KAK0563658.1 hypothetical protein OC844_002106 [Tilletia horrida]